MTIGSTMPIVTTMDAGATAAAADQPGVPARAGGAAIATMIDLNPARAAGSAFERLVPPFLERSVVLCQVSVIEIDQALTFLGVEADALFGCGRNLGVGHRGVVAHVLGEGFLRRWLEHLVQPDMRSVLVRRVLGNDEARDVQRYPLLRRHGLHLRAGLLPLHGARLPHDADA